MAAIRADYFGSAAFGTISGVSSMVAMLGMMGGRWWPGSSPTARGATGWASPCWPSWRSWAPSSSCSRRRRRRPASTAFAPAEGRGGVARAACRPGCRSGVPRPGGSSRGPDGHSVLARYTSPADLTVSQETEPGALGDHPTDLAHVRAASDRQSLCRVCLDHEDRRAGSAMAATAPKIVSMRGARGPGRLVEEQEPWGCPSARAHGEHLFLRPRASGQLAPPAPGGSEQAVHPLHPLTWARSRQRWAPRSRFSRTATRGNTWRPLCTSMPWATTRW